MAEICCDVVSENKSSATTCEQGSRSARRRRMEIRRFKFVADVPDLPEPSCKRLKLDDSPLPARECLNAVENCAGEGGGACDSGRREEEKRGIQDSGKSKLCYRSVERDVLDGCPRFGMMSVCGRRRDMEDAVSIHPSFARRECQIPAMLHFFGVYDGHGCSHVAMSCKDRLHDLLKEEFANLEPSTEWKDAMVRSFSRMDNEVSEMTGVAQTASCRCELRTPQCDAVGSTAVVAVVEPDKIVVANCGDSRAVLCRNGKPIPLSSDHKPDRPDELERIQAAGGRVIYWDGPRVLGVLAMSRAIGDSYLKPYVSSEPEVTEMERSADDECLILASDGLWDVVSNSTACDIARMCLRGRVPSPGNDAGDFSDKTCADAAMLLTKMALARHSTDNVSVIVVDLRRDT
eukprot:TRINITY_DN2156_c0_g1_i4.p1 TRINITY_DN2156_c0_g1~~TRINITY_DN2156_c0_g1_i4.p1  ORF type:complete len:440 (-),score=-4.79 TRINITY_DN2156_c0_g1_i4:325-1536(-)